MPSSKLSTRRKSPLRPAICRKQPAPLPLAPYGPATVSVLTSYGPHPPNSINGVLVNARWNAYDDETLVTVSAVPSGGFWFGPNSARNTIPVGGNWMFPGAPGIYTITVTATWPDSTSATDIATAEVA